MPLSQLIVYLGISIPKVEASLIIFNTSAFLSNDFVGIHPQFKHIPPNVFFSIIATYLPNCAALIAATYPPGPDPITITSYFLGELWIKAIF